jgi:hypothetical protein
MITDNVYNMTPIYQGRSYDMTYFTFPYDITGYTYSGYIKDMETDQFQTGFVMEFDYPNKRLYPTLSAATTTTMTEGTFKYDIMEIDLDTHYNEISRGNISVLPVVTTF